MGCGDGVGRGGGLVEIVDRSCRRGVCCVLNTLFSEVRTGTLVSSILDLVRRLDSPQNYLHMYTSVGKNLLDFCPLLLLGVKNLLAS